MKITDWTPRIWCLVVVLFSFVLSEPATGKDVGLEAFLWGGSVPVKGSKTQPCDVLALRPHPLTSLCLTFLIFKMGIITILGSRGSMS